MEHSIAPNLLLQCLQQRPGHKFSIHLTPRQHLYPKPQTALQCLLNSNHILAAQSPFVWKPSPAPSPQETLQPQAATTPPGAPLSSYHGVTKPILGLRWLLAVLELKKMTAWDSVSTRPWRVTYPLILCRSSQPNSQAPVTTTDCPLRHTRKWPAQLARHPRSVLMLTTPEVYMQCVFKDHSVETEPDQETGDR